MLVYTIALVNRVVVTTNLYNYIAFVLLCLFSIAAVYMTNKVEYIL